MIAVFQVRLQISQRARSSLLMLIDRQPTDQCDSGEQQAIPSILTGLLREHLEEDIQDSSAHQERRHSGQRHFRRRQFEVSGVP